jgi:hypothetical protein
MIRTPLALNRGFQWVPLQRDGGGIMGPVLEEEPVLPQQGLELRRFVVLQAAAEDEVVGPLHDVDGVHLYIAQLLDEGAQAVRRGPQEGLPGQEEAAGLGEGHGRGPEGHGAILANSLQE